MAKMGLDEEEKEAKPAKKRLALPKVKLPQLKLSSIRLPTVDIGIIATGLIIAFISAMAAMLGVHLFLPERKVLIVRSPAEVERAKRFNAHGVPALTIGPNVNNDFVTHISNPRVAGSAFIHPQASLLGAVEIGDKVYVAPQASIRGDEGQDLHVGAMSGVLDGAVIHGPPTEDKGIYLERNQVRVDGQRYSVYLGERVTMSPQSQVYGPSIVGDDTYIGNQVLVFRSMVGKRCVLEPRSAVIGVIVPDGHYVPAGVVVKTQTQADILPVITAEYGLRDVNAQAILVNVALAQGYNALYPKDSSHSEPEGH